MDVFISSKVFGDTKPKVDLVLGFFSSIESSV